MREHDQARSLDEEQMGPDCWLGVRCGMTHPLPISGAYGGGQTDHLRWVMRMLHIDWAPGAESAALLAARALSELGLGAVNAQLVLAILQNNPLAHLVVEQPDSNWVMRGFPRVQKIAVHMVIVAGDHHLHYNEPILRGGHGYRLPISTYCSAAFEYCGRHEF